MSVRTAREISGDFTFYLCYPRGIVDIISPFLRNAKDATATFKKRWRNQ